MRLTAVSVAAALAVVFLAATAAAPKVRVARGSPAAHLVFVNDWDGDVDVYAVDSEGRRVVALTRNRVWEFFPVVARSGAVALVRDDRDVLVSADGRRERLLGHTGGLAAWYETALFSPDGRLVIPETGKVLIPVAGGRARPLPAGWRYVYGFTADSRKMLVKDARNRLGVADVASFRLRPLPRLKADLRQAGVVRLSPSGRRVALVVWHGEGHYQLFVLDRDRPVSGNAPVLSGQEISGIAWLPGERLGYSVSRAGAGSEVGIVSSSGRVRTVARGWDGVWSPRGDWVAYRPDANGSSGTIVLRSPAGRTRSFPGSLEQAIWSPSGARFAFRQGDDVWVFAADTGQAKRVARAVSAGASGAEIGAWAPDERHLAVTTNRDLVIVDADSGKVVRPVRTGISAVLGWADGRLPAAAPTVTIAPLRELVVGRSVRARGTIAEIAADGHRVAALVNNSSVDCAHPMAWVAGTKSVIRFTRVGICETGNFDYFGLELRGTRLSWRSFYCGNHCYVAGCSADIQKPGTGTDGASGAIGCDVGNETDDPSFEPPRRLPPIDPHGGIKMTVSKGAILLSRLADGRRRVIRPPGGAIDAELEDAGLFYAYNLRHDPLPGRIVFLPRPSLFA